MSKIKQNHNLVSAGRKAIFKHCDSRLDLPWLSGFPSPLEWLDFYIEPESEKKF